MKKALILSARGEETFSPDQVHQLKSCLDIHFEKCLDPLSSAAFIHLAEPYEILGVTRRPLKDLGRPILSRLRRLEGLAVYSTGYEWVDLEYLREHKIPLCYLPDYSTVTVAEHVFGCLLTLSRRIHLSFDRVRGNVPTSVSLRGWDLFGKTLGVVGFGRIGKRVVFLGKGFGMNILIADPKRMSGPSGRMKVSLSGLLKNSDAVVLCCGKERGGKPLLGSRELRRMKTDAILINVGRESLVDNQAILAALKAREIAGYAVDDRVEAFCDEEDLEPGRLLQTGHTGWYSNEAIARGTQAWVDNLKSLAEGKPIHRAV